MTKLILMSLILPSFCLSQTAQHLTHSPPTICGIIEVVATYDVKGGFAFLTMFKKSQNSFTINLKDKPNSLALKHFVMQKVRAKLELLHLNSPRLATAKGLEMSLVSPQADALHQGDGFRILEAKNCIKNP